MGGQHILIETGFCSPSLSEDNTNILILLLKMEYSIH